MAWYRMDENFVENDKVQQLKHPAFRLHVGALGYCSRNLTDGYISDRAVKVLAAILEYPVGRHVAQLVEVGLWAPEEGTEGGYWINDYLVYNPDAETVKKVRDERSTAGKKGAAKRWGDGNGHRQEPQQEPDNTVTAPDLKKRFLKAVPAHEEIKREIDKLAELPGHDENSWNVIASYAVKLDLPTIARIRLSAREGGKGVKWVVRALQSELAERSAA